MLTLGEIINEISKIRDLIDSVEVKGYDNCHRMTVAYERCNNLITAINQVAKEIQNKGEPADTESPKEG